MLPFHPEKRPREAVQLACKFSVSLACKFEHAKHESQALSLEQLLIALRQLIKFLAMGINIEGWGVGAGICYSHRSYTNQVLYILSYYS